MESVCSCSHRYYWHQLTIFQVVHFQHPLSFMSSCHLPYWADGFVVHCMCSFTMSWLCDKTQIWRVDRWHVNRVTTWLCDELTGSRMNTCLPPTGVTGYGALGHMMSLDFQVFIFSVHFTSAQSLTVTVWLSKYIIVCDSSCCIYFSCQSTHYTVKSSQPIIMWQLDSYVKQSCEWQVDHTLWWWSVCSCQGRVLRVNT